MKTLVSLRETPWTGSCSEGFGSGLIALLHVPESCCWGSANGRSQVDYNALLSSNSPHVLGNGLTCFFPFLPFNTLE